MAQLLEPFALDMERSSVNRLGKDVQQPLIVDYSKLPRSSGDGMEFTISSSSEGLSSGEETDEDTFTLSYKTSSKFTRNHTVDHLHKNRSVLQARKTSRVGNKRDDLQLTPSEASIKALCADTASTESSKVEKPENQTIPAVARENTDHKTHPQQIIHCQNSVNLLLQSADLPGLDSHPELSLTGSSQIVSLAPPAADLTFTDNLLKSIVLEQNAKYVDSWKVINDLEEQNSKLVEEKTKLTVQLGIQTKVNADIKKLLVASVGEDVCNRLEDLVTRNTQQTVELNHWKKMCEEYSEESDRLEIECDVWRTKFLASRMMSDELSSWKVALYTRFRQAQSALERLLHERSELQQHLIQTRRLIQSLHSILKCTNGRQPNVATEQHVSNDQSILEMASVNTSLARETWDLAESVLPMLSLSEASMMLTQSQENSGQELHMEPTPAEKLAIQVLSSDVDLQVEEEQVRGVMKRMGQQYMGHGYHGRFSTKTFRVTYDCCNRCTGALHVV